MKTTKSGVFYVALIVALACSLIPCVPLALADGTISLTTLDTA